MRSSEYDADVERFGGVGLRVVVGEQSNGREPPGPMDVHRRLTPGGSFLLDAPAEPPAVWGSDDAVLWAQGEPLLLVGPAGVGKTTLGGQLVEGRLGLLDEVLGYPVVPGSRRVLYLACDRPRQIARALRRPLGEDHRRLLDERLVVWEGPPAQDLGQHPEVLIELAKEADADTVVIDSLKDVALGLAYDEVGAGLNRAMQQALVEGVEVLAHHHQRKGQGGEKPRTLEAVYGSTWLTAGAGSVILLWGAAGDLVVDLEHLKQPATEVGPLKVVHDHHTGRSTVLRGFDVLTALRHAPGGFTTTEVARLMLEKAEPGENDRRKAQRQLDALVRKGLAHRTEPERGGASGTKAARYYAVETLRTEGP